MKERERVKKQGVSQKLKREKAKEINMGLREVDKYTRVDSNLA